jgi:hypothetical protein
VSLPWYDRKALAEQIQHKLKCVADAVAAALAVYRYFDPERFAELFLKW